MAPARCLAGASAYSSRYLTGSGSPLRLIEGDADADAASDVRPGGEATARGQGRSGADPRGPRAARGAARLPERPVRGPAQVAPRGDRGHPGPVERRPPRLDRGPPRGCRPDRARRAAERRQVVAPPGAVGDPDQDRRLPVHDAPAGAGADPDRRRPRPARRDPRADRGRRATTGAAAGRCSASCARPTRSSTAARADARPGRARGRPRRGRGGRASTKPAILAATRADEAGRGAHRAPRERRSRTSRSSRSRSSTRRRSRRSATRSGR